MAEKITEIQDIQKLINDLREIPAMPNVVMQAINLVKNPNASIKDLANIISYDQSLSAKVNTCKLGLLRLFTTNYIYQQSFSFDWYG